MGQGIGSIFVALCLLFFAFSTILSWNLFAKLNVDYLFGRNAIRPFCVIALVFVFLGCILSNDLVWELADLFNQLMVLPNVIALVALSGAVATCAKSRGEKVESKYLDDAEDASAE
jgi:AGCS family alanine or glycine:cation symporter